MNQSQQQQTNQGNLANNGSNHYLPQTSNNYVQQTNSNSSNSLTSSSGSNKISEDHKAILEGVKLSMEVIDSRIPNYSGYAHLILSKNVAYLENLVQRPFRKEIIEILDK